MNAYELRISELENEILYLQKRLDNIEKRLIDPLNIVSFTAVAVCGQMGLKPIQMTPGIGHPTTQVGLGGQAAYEHDVNTLKSLALRHKLLR